MPGETVGLSALHPVRTSYSPRHVSQAMLDLLVDRVVVVFAVILLAAVAQMVLVAEFTVGDSRVETFLLVGSGLAHGSVDALTRAVYGNASLGVAGRRAKGYSSGSGGAYGDARVGGGG